MQNTIQSLPSIIQLLITALLCPPKALQESLEEYAARGGSWGLPVVLVGPPGVGKTDTIKQVARLLSLACYTFPVDSMEIEDLSGVMVHVGEGRIRRSTDNYQVEEIIEAGEGVLFVDEINTGRGLDAALNRLVYEREFCKKQLPPGVRVLAAMNPPHLSAGGRPLRPSLANRLCHIPYEGHNPSAWSSYIHSPPTQTVYSLPELRGVLNTNWEEARRKAGMAASAFMSSQGMYLNRVPEAGKSELHGAWPSERTWHMAVNTYATCLALGVSNEVTDLLLSGCLGSECALTWKTYRESLDLPSLEDVLEGKWVKEAGSARSDVVFAVADAVAGWLAEGKTAVTPRIAANLYQTIQVCRDIDCFYAVARKLSRLGYGASLQLKPKKTDEDKRLADLATSVLGRFPANIYNPS